MSERVLVLGIETSCDETAAAVVENGTEVLASRVHSQIELHRRFGGIVPELASRDHLARVLPVIDETLSLAGRTLAEIDCIAATSGPGLVGALLVGLQVGKGLAAASGKPLVAVNHLEGHVCAVRLEAAPPSTPFVALIVSGGHTSLYRVDGGPAWHFELLGRTRDDAAGEAFDKTGRLLGLPYPAGRAMDELAAGHDPKTHDFPRGLHRRGELDFSFSGLKTSARQFIEKNGVPEGDALGALCASVQEAIVDPLVRKSIAAAEIADVQRLVVCGGVAANSRLREKLRRACEEAGVQLWIPAVDLCTDNAAMIAAAGSMHFEAGDIASLDRNADPGWRLGT